MSTQQTTNNLDNQVSYWDSVAEEKEFSHPLHEELVTRLVRKDQRILDYGCGYGRTCDDLWNLKFRNIIGVDTSARMIARGRRAYPHLDLRVVTSLPLPFAPATFDVVLLFTLLTCIPTDEGQRQVLDEMTRLLRPQGILYLSDLLLQQDRRNLERYQLHAERFGTYGVFELEEGVVCRHHELAWIASLTAGFATTMVRELDVVTMNQHHARGFQYIGRKR